MPRCRAIYSRQFARRVVSAVWFADTLLSSSSSLLSPSSSAFRPRGYAHRVFGRSSLPREQRRAPPWITSACCCSTLNTCTRSPWVSCWYAPFSCLSSASRRPSSRRSRSSPRAPTWTGSSARSAARSARRLVKRRRPRFPLPLSLSVSPSPRALFLRRHVAIARHMVARLWARVDAHAHTPANQLVPPVREGDREVAVFLLPAHRDVMLRRGLFSLAA